MRMRTIAIVFFASHVLAIPTFAQPATSRVAETSRLEFHSDVLMNLHHTLFGAAWARRPQAGTLQALAGALPAPPDAALSAEERAAWNGAVDYYDKELASRDLLRGKGMYEIKMALVAGDLTSEAIGKPLRAVLASALPVYRKHFWPSHDRINRAWIDRTVRGVRDVGPQVIERLTKLYGRPWFDETVRVDVVWVGNRQGAYATDEPTHATISSGDPGNSGWAAVEIVFHEVSHTLIAGIEKQLATALGDRLREHGILWHVVQFYITGYVVRAVLAARKVEYTPVVEEIFGRAWGQYRGVVAQNWQPYVDGKVTLQQAIDGTVRALQ
jgi:hypothetical protein